MKKHLSPINFYSIKNFTFLLFIFLSSFGFAQNQRCTIYFKDHKILEGLGRLKLDGSIKFRLNNDSESEIYENELIDKVQISTNGGSDIYKYKNVKDDSAIWLKVIIEGKVTLFTNDITGFNFNSAGMSPMGGMSYGSSTVTHYYVSHEGEYEVFKITSLGTISKNFKKAASDFFKDCLVLVEKIQNKTYTKNDLEEVVKFYNSKCN